MPQTHILGVALELFALAALDPQQLACSRAREMSALACLVLDIAMLVQPERCFASLVEILIRAMPVADMDVASWALD